MGIREGTVAAAATLAGSREPYTPLTMGNPVLPGSVRLPAPGAFIFCPMLSVTFLGTSAARPTVERGVSSLALVREGETLLFDCGEGTQRQMMRYGVSFALTEIFFTHFHADHFLGIIGLMRTLGLQGRAEPMRLYGPKGAKKVLTNAISLGVERVPFGVEMIEVAPGDEIERQPAAGAHAPGQQDHRCL